MVSQYTLPLLSIAGMIASYYLIRRTRDKQYIPSLFIFVVPLVLDLFIGIEQKQPVWATVIKSLVLAAGWLFLLLTFKGSSNSKS